MVGMMIKIEEVSKRALLFAQTNGLQFTFKGKILSLEEVFSPVGILPGMIKRANKLSSLCIGTSIGADFLKKKSRC